LPLGFDKIGSVGRKNRDNRNDRIIGRLFQRGKLLVSFATMGKGEEKIEELDELMENLDIGEAMGHLDLDQKDFTIQSGSVFGNMH
jgi:hypothetical protein